MQSRIVTIITLALSISLFACSGEKPPHERLAGTWDVDDKASWEYQRPGVAYEPSIAELERDISLQFDTKEQTCRVLDAFGNHLLRYRVAAEEKDKATLSIGENTFIFEFKTDDRLLLCPPGSGVENCLILARGSASAEAEAARMVKAELRLAEIVKRHTQSVASRTEQFLINTFLASGGPVINSDVFRFYVSEMDALGGEKSGESLPADENTSMMTALLRDVVQNGNMQYARIYTRNGIACLASDANLPSISAMQNKFIMNVVSTGNHGPIALISSGNELLFELYLPLLHPLAKTEKDIAGVLTLARSIYPLPDGCLIPDVSISGGSLYFIRYTGKNYQIIGTQSVKAEVQALELNDAGEMPFARRNSLVGDKEVCSQASHGPATNSWVLVETNCASPSLK